MTHRLLGRLLLLGGAIVVLGSLLPWQAVDGLGTTLNIDGIDSPNNGVVTLICDSGERYRHSYYNDEWVEQQGLDPRPYRSAIDRFLGEGTWEPPPVTGNAP